MDKERFKQEQNSAPDQDVLRTSAEQVRDNYIALVGLARTATHAKNIFENILRIDQMGRAFERGAIDTHRAIGAHPFIRQTLKEEMDTAEAANDNQRVMELIRVGYLLGYTEDPQRIRAAQRLANFVEQRVQIPPVLRFRQWIDQQAVGQQAAFAYEIAFEQHKTALEDKRFAEAAIARMAARKAARAAKPRWKPEDTTGKSAEWQAARAAFEPKWQTASQGLPTDAATDVGIPSAMIRFQEATALLHEQILSSKPTSNQAFQAIVEYLIPRVWISGPDQVAKFFKIAREQDDVRTVADLDELTQALFIPKDLRGSASPLNRDLKRRARKLWSKFNHVINEDHTKLNPDTDPNLKDQLGLMLQAINTTYDSFK